MPVYSLGGVSPRIHSSAWIAPGAMIIGDVTIGEGASVWFNAVLRGDNEPIVVGPRCNVQDGAVLHTDPGFPVKLAEGVTVGHAAIVHGCTVGQGSLIGMGASVLNGAVIGAGSLVGANALVGEGKEFGDGLLILGAPAKVLRDLTTEQRQHVIAAATRYTEKASRFSRDLVELEA